MSKLSYEELERVCKNQQDRLANMDKKFGGDTMNSMAQQMSYEQLYQQWCNQTETIKQLQMQIERLSVEKQLFESSAETVSTERNRLKKDNKRFAEANERQSEMIHNLQGNLKLVRERPTQQTDPRYNWEVYYATSIDLANAKHMLEKEIAKSHKLEAKIRRQRASIQGQEKMWLQTKLSLMTYITALQEQLLAATDDKLVIAEEVRNEDEETRDPRGH